MRVPLMTGRIAIALVAASLAASACSPEAAPPVPADREEGGGAPGGGPAASSPAAPAPKAVSAPAPAETGERRCGWLSNPTPANWWLTDRDGQWILGSQGGEQVAGMEDMPDMTSAGWVETNGHYGYGCACMTLSYDAETRRVTRIADAQPKPLRQCRADRKLPAPE